MLKNWKIAPHPGRVAWMALAILSAALLLSIPGRAQAQSLPALNASSSIASAAGDGWDDGFALPPGGLGVANYVNYVLAHPDGSIYASGAFTQAGTVSATAIARWDPATRSWSALGSGLAKSDGSPGVGYQMAVDAGGNVYVAGQFATAGGQTANNVAMWNPATQQWSALGSGASTTLQGVAVGSNGLVYVGGCQNTTVGGLSVKATAKWDPAAQQWSSVGGGVGDACVRRLAADAAGRVYYVGSFTKVNGTSLDSKGVAIWDTNTANWSALGKGLTREGESSASLGNVTAAAVDASGNFYIGGRITHATQADGTKIAVNRIARWDPAAQQWSTVGGGLVGSAITASPEPEAIVVDGSNVFVGGTFAAVTAGGVTVNHIAMWDGQNWSNLDGGMDDHVSSLAVDASGNLYAGGWFTSAGSTPVPSSRFAVWQAQPPPSCTDPLVVRNNSDSSPESLRWAVEECPSDLILFDSDVFSVPTTITLASQIDITRSLTISGTGAENVIVSGDNITRVFNINDSSLNVTIQGITVRDGIVNGGFGGGIYSTAALTLTGVTIANNQVTGASATSGYGAGLYTTGPTRIASSLFYSNTSKYVGGAIYVVGAGAGSLTLDAVDVISNTAGSYGGGIYSYDGVPVTLTNSLVQGNAADSGGAIYVDGNDAGSLTLDTVDVISNTSSNFGGGIYIYSDVPVTLTNSLFQGNASYTGGAICAEGSAALPLVIQDTDFLSNMADDYGDGGAISFYSNAQLDMQGGSFRGNKAQYGGAISAGDSSRLDVVDVQFSDNTALKGGGGIYTEGPLTLSHVTFDGSQVTRSGYYGGALYLYDSYALLDADQITVTNNVAVQGYGGGLYIEGDVPVTLTNSLFQGNSSTKGGAIYAEGDVILPLAIRDTDFYSNTADSRGGANTADSRGGALYIKTTALTVTSTTFVSNTAQGFGGALFSFGNKGSVFTDVQAHNNSSGSSGGAFYTAAPASIANGVFTGNVARFDGGGASFRGNVVMTGTLFTGNRSDTGGGFSVTDVTVGSNITVTGNSAGALGGGIENQYGTLRVDGLLLEDNTSSWDGGGIWNSGELALANARIANNSVIQPDSGNGGGIWAGDPLSLTTTTVISNFASGSGGGIYTTDPLTLTQVTLAENEAGGMGGGVYSTDSAVLVNSTLYANEAMTGGAIYNGGVLDVQFSTLSGNQAPVGGGIYDDGAGTPVVVDSIVANSGAGAVDLVGGAFDSGAAAVRNVLSGTVALGPLQDNGGSTPTMALVGSSPAVDAAACGSVTVDQRGVSRPQGANCDLGAFEADNTLLSDLAIDPGVLAPAFLSTTLEYTARVPFSAASTVVTATPDAGGAVTVTIEASANGGAPAACAGSPVSCALAVGTNVITTTVTGADGTFREYVVTVTRASDATLGGLAVSPGALAPGFVTSTLNYTTAAVSNVTAAMLVTPTLQTGDTVSVTVAQNSGAPVACTGNLFSCPLAVGENVITVTVTAIDGTTRSYTVTTLRASDATLGGLAISPGALAPGFVTNTLNYTTAAVSNATAAMLVTPTLQAGDTVSVTVAANGGAAAACSGSPLSCPLAVGENVITTTVTAADGTTQSYTVTTVRASDATLGGLEVSPGALAPGFVTSTLNYTTAAVNNATAAMLVTPTLQAGDTVSVTVAANGGAAAACSGSPLSCPLAVGENVITTTVTAADGTTRSYTVTTARASDATLGGLAISPGALAPGFVTSTLNYTTAAVSNATAAMLVTPTVAYPFDAVSIEVAANGGAAAACSGSPLSCPLAVGENVITTTVTAADGTTRSYTVTTVRASDATLGALAISPGALAPGFVGSTLNYTAEVGNAVAGMAVTPTLQAGDTVSVEAAANGGAPAACTGNPVDCPLAVGTNVITVTVTAADGTTRSYTVTVTRAAPSSDATLSGLALNDSTGAVLLAPAFDAAVTDYTASVANSESSVAVTAAANDPGATVTSVTAAANGGVPAACTGDPVSCPLAVGTNVITVTVTAADGTTQSYTVTVTRAAPDGDASLSSLVLSHAGTQIPLSPAFASSVTTYTADVGSAVDSAAVAALTSAPGALVTSVTVAANGGAPVACSGTPVSCPLAVGENLITVTVTAADGTTRSYTVTVTRAAPDASDATLGSLALNDSVGAVPLAPAFNGSITSYTASVGNGESSVAVVAEPNDLGASVTSVTVVQNGGAPVACTGDPVSCPLAVGENVITVTVAAADGTTQSYTVTVTRAAPDSDASLSSLALSHAGTQIPLAPAFASSVTAYTAYVGSAVDSALVAALTSAPGALVTSMAVAQNGGAPVACTGDPVTCPLAVGTNVITVTVTAADGTTRSYTVTVTRAAPDASDATLGSLALNDSAGAVPLVPVFDGSITSYTASVGSSESSVTLQAEPNDLGASVTSVTAAQNGGAPVVCTADPVSCPLAVGTNVITVTVTAADGTTQSYTVTITRAAPPAVVAVNDAAGVLEGESVVIAPLANDLDPAAGGLLVAAVTDPANGTAVVNGDGRTVTYTPDAGFKGLDNFRYTAQDANGAISEAIVSVVVRVKGDSAAPQVAPVDPTRTTTATFTTRTGGVTIVLPPGSYDGSQGPLGPTDVFYIAFTEILTPTSNVDTPPGTLSFGGKIFTLEAFFNDIKLDNYVFPQPVTFTVLYDPAQINDLLPETLQLFYWDVDIQQWSAAGLTFVSRDTANHTITYQVAHFTEFAYFGEGQAEVVNNLYLPLVAKVSVAYSSNFAGGVTDNWTPQQLTTAPNGQRFLGEFANDTARLSLAGLEPHSRVTVSFELHIIRSWDGDQVSLPPDFDPYAQLELAAVQAMGPDHFLVRAGGETLFDATFSSWGQFTQSFPAPNAPARSGALATNSLGYRFSRLDLPLDATYRITLSFAHSAAALALEFSGAGLQGVDDESWGIDNVAVTLH